MDIKPKFKAYLNKKCKKAFGLSFDDTYNHLKSLDKKREAIKKEQKKQKNEQKRLKRLAKQKKDNNFKLMK